MVKSKVAESKAGQEYAFSYESDISTSFFSSRTADSCAKFLLPFLRSGMTLLDCGCGGGSITVGLAKTVEPGHVTGVDVSELEIIRARERAAKEKTSNIQFEVGDICQLNFSDNSFDALFSHNVLEHIPESGKALLEMKRVLRPGGIIGIRDIDFGGFLVAPDDGLLERLFAVFEEYSSSLGGNPRIGRSLGKLFYEAGFMEVKTSASYEVYSDLESRRFLAQNYACFFNETGFLRWIDKSGKATEKECKKMKDAWMNWKELPGAFHARSHCEAVGRKAWY